MNSLSMERGRVWICHHVWAAYVYKYVSDEILSGKNLFISSAAAAAFNSHRSKVSWGREKSAISSFAIYLPEPVKW